MEGGRVGRHRVQAATPSEDDRSGGGARPPIGGIVPRLRAAVRSRLGEPVRERPKAVLTGAAAVVSLMALCGVVALARGFAPTAEACSTSASCASGRADPRPSTPVATPTGHPHGSTLAPAVVREEKRTRPRATAPDNGPVPPPWMPGPGWHRHGPPPGHGHGPRGR